MPASEAEAEAEADVKSENVSLIESFEKLDQDAGALGQDRASSTSTPRYRTLFSILL
jgi:hypothetical protein